MITLRILLILLLCAPAAFAEQALVLTEIEQIQEKIWYLQRDVAAHKAALDKQSETLETLVADAGDQRDSVESRIRALTALINNRLDGMQQLDSRLQGMQEQLDALAAQFNAQDRTRLAQAEKSGQLEGTLSALRAEYEAATKTNAQALAATQQKLADLQGQLQALQQQGETRFDRLGLYVGGAALGLALLLTIGFGILGSRAKRRADTTRRDPGHEL